MNELAESGLILVGLVLLFVAIGWTGSSVGSAVLRWRTKRVIAIFVVLALIAYFGVGIILETTG